MKIALDIIVAVILVISTIIGIKKGFIKTVLGLIGVLLVFMLAYELATPFGNYLDQKVVNPAFRKTVSAKIADKIGVELQEDTDREEQLQGFESEIAEIAKTDEFDVISNGAAEIKQAANEAKGAVVTTIFDAVDRASAGTARVIAVILLLIAGFLVLFLLRLIIKPLLKVFHLKSCDAVLGGALGFVRGILFVLLFAFIIRLALPAINEKISKEDIDKTIIFGYAYRLVDGE